MPIVLYFLSYCMYLVFKETHSRSYKDPSRQINLFMFMLEVAGYLRELGL